MQMVKLREELRHPIAHWHVVSDFLAASVIVDVAVGIDNLHGSLPLFSRSASP
jgi:hypothetical protein